jgi:hypothetical protein
MHRHLKIPILTLRAVAAGGPATARAQTEATAKPDTSTQVGELKLDPTFALDPTAPQVGALPGGLAPAYGQKAMSEGEWRFDFHGFIIAPLVASFGSRSAARGCAANPIPGCEQMPVQPGQSDRTLHSPQVVPDDLETFSHTGVVPTTYAQLNFSEGNSIITAHANVVARQANVSTGFLEPASQLGVSDLYLSILPRLERVRTEIFVGGFASRYGTTGQYDEGRYGTPLIGRVNGSGQRVTARLPLGRWTILAEEGLVGQTNKANAATTPDVWNDFANSNEGATFVAHAHLGANYDRLATLGAHYLGAWSQDDRATGTLAPDGNIDIYAADLRLTMGRFGYLYAAGSYTDAKWAKTVSRIVSVLNTRGGQGLIDNYFGPNSNGNGNLTTVGFQYDLSIGRLVSYPVPFSGDGPDLFVSLFGMMVHVNSDDKDYDNLGRYFDNVNKLKYGAMATYGFLSWVAVSGRVDHVDPDLDDTSQSFTVVSPAVILRTDWQATDQLVIQYSHWFNGANVFARSGSPARETVFPVPDSDMISISANMWW